MNTAFSLPPGTLLSGKFRIERQLGAGAMGAVYAIHHELTRHRRALKLLHPEVRMSPDLVRRFLNEASAAGRAGNPHLVETFDAGTLDSGEPYVVMELLEGESLGALIERERQLSVALCAELLAQAAEGVDAAHAAGIIHRDLKPENLFVTERDGRPFIKILDFGVSKFKTASGVSARSTRAGDVCGSPAYMSPEQLQGRLDIDARSDVFALGVVLYECLSGRMPFVADTFEALAVRIVTCDCAPIEELRPDMPPALTQVVQRALRPHRNERYHSARAMAEALAPLRAQRDITRSGVVQQAELRTDSDTLSVPLGNNRAPLRISLAVAIVLCGLCAYVLLSGRPSSAIAPARVSNSGLGQVANSAAPPNASPHADTKRDSNEHNSVLAAAASEPVAPAHSRARAKPPKVDVPVAATPAAASVATPVRASTAQNLGLSQDNPFR